MTDISKHSLGELKELYTRKIRYWSEQQLEHEKQLARCKREIKACEATRA